MSQAQRLGVWLVKMTHNGSFDGSQFHQIHDLIHVSLQSVLVNHAIDSQLCTEQQGLHHICLGTLHTKPLLSYLKPGKRKFLSGTEGLMDLQAILGED